MTKLIMDACCNHLREDKLIETFIESAANNGADYIKFQLFNTNVLSTNFPNREQAYINYSRMELDQCNILDILRISEKNGIRPMFTIFSEDRIKVLLDCIKPGQKYAVKVASPDMSNAGLVQQIRMDFPPDVELFISTGMHTIQEVQEARFRMEAAVNTRWLYCISKYPTPYEEVDFGAMQAYDGFSDHTLGIEAAKRAMEFGIPFIEKHFTLSRNLPGKDQSLSITPEELAALVHHNKYLASIEVYKNRWKGGNDEEK